MEPFRPREERIKAALALNTSPSLQNLQKRTSTKLKPKNQPQPRFYSIAPLDLSHLLNKRTSIEILENNMSCIALDRIQPATIAVDLDMASKPPSHSLHSHMETKETYPQMTQTTLYPNDASQEDEMESSPNVFSFLQTDPEQSKERIPQSRLNHDQRREIINASPLKSRSSQLENTHKPTELSSRKNNSSIFLPQLNSARPNLLNSVNLTTERHSNHSLISLPIISSKSTFPLLLPTTSNFQTSKISRISENELSCNNISNNQIKIKKTIDIQKGSSEITLKSQNTKELSSSPGRKSKSIKTIQMNKEKKQKSSFVSSTTILLKKQPPQLSQPLINKNPFLKQKPQIQPQPLKVIQTTLVEFERSKCTEQQAKLEPTLTEEEIIQYKVKQLHRDKNGECIPNYKKLSLLGKGGFSLVWRCEDQRNKEEVAVKQISMKNHGESCHRELSLIRTFYNDNGTPKSQDPRIQYLPGVKEIISESEFTWIVFSLGGDCLSSRMTTLKGDFHRGLRVYRIDFHHDYFQLFRVSSLHTSLLRRIIYDTTSALSLISENSYVHGDIKPENILISVPEKQNILERESPAISARLIDFGSSINFKEKANFSMLTAEYMPPEVISLLIAKDSNSKQTQQQHHQQLGIPLTMMETLLFRGHLAAIDIWSLGLSLLEILTGIPLWLGYQCSIHYGNKHVIRSGLLSIKNADYNKLLEKQRDLVEQLPQLLRSTILPFFDDSTASEQLLDLIRQMLVLNPAERITSKEILSHPFLLPLSQKN